MGSLERENLILLVYDTRLIYIFGKIIEQETPILQPNEYGTCYYRMKSPNALFLLRDPGILKDISDTHIARYKDTEPLCREHLKVLHKRALDKEEYLMMIKDNFC